MSEWYRLRLAGISDSVIFKLMNDYESIDELLKEPISKLELYYKVEASKFSYICNDKKLSETLDRYNELSINLISYKDSTYPYLLKNINSPPPFLYIKGKGSIRDKSIGVVGTRKMTREGKGACEYIVKGLARAGIDIVSGLALGVDSCAHRVTIANDAQPIAVIGSGIDIVYPPSNRELYREVEERGLIISELAPGTEPAKWTFPRRNRIISGLSRGVLVTESYERGGSLITAKEALEEGRDVFAIPGMINYPSFAGCNKLIKQGEAKLVTCPEDILEEYDWSSKKQLKNIKFERLEEEIIYNELVTPKNLDELILKTGIGARDLLITIGGMELEGYIKSVAGGKYSRKE